jgi:glycosyltransferase involved in cell wall biosynthesis
MTQYSAKGEISKVITVIPVYNGERFLGATLESVAQQTRRPDRLIIIDDGSTDGTKELVHSFKDLPCEWHPNPKNLGLFPNLNKALAKASETDFFHLLLADDLVTPISLNPHARPWNPQFQCRSHGATLNGLMPMEMKHGACSRYQTSD